MCVYKRERERENHVYTRHMYGPARVKSVDFALNMLEPIELDHTSCTDHGGPRSNIYNRSWPSWNRTHDDSCTGSRKKHVRLGDRQNLFQTCWAIFFAGKKCVSLGGSSSKIRVGQTVKPKTVLCRSTANEILIKQNMEKTQALENQQALIFF